MVRIGLAMPQAGPTATAEGMSTAALLAERLGYDSLWLGDHVVIPEELDSSYPYGSFTVDSRETYFDPLGALGFLGGATQRIALGLSVLVIPLRNPVVTAKQLATIDNLTSGRVILGAGSGWLHSEFRALGLEDSMFDRRGSVTDEWLDIFQELWEHKTTSSFSGEFYQLGPVRCFPKPARSSGIPVWGGGNTKAALRRAAKRDGWQALRVSVAEFEESARILRIIRAESGLHGDFTLAHRCFVGCTRDAVQDHDYMLTGEPSACAERLDRYVQAGCSHFIFDLQQWPADSLSAYLETAEWFASEVRPLLSY